MEYPSLDTAKAGAMRFNTDSIQMEIYDGNQWIGVVSDSPELHTGGTRGIFAGGFTQSGNSNRDVIEFFNVDTTGNCADFGNLTSSRRCQGQGAGSRTRGIFMGGRASPANRDVIDFITIASTGNAQDFGNLTDGGASNSGQGGNATRAVCNGGQRGSTGTTKKNIIDFITIASTGDAVDFGDSTVSRVTQTGGLNSPTRGVFAGGYTPTQINTIEYITFSTQGDAADFGDLSYTVRRPGGGSNAIRGIIMGGNNYDSAHIGLDNIEYITIATLGNSIDFGDMVSASSADTCACAASRTRAVYHRTDTGTGLQTNTMDYVTIMSTGNALDFGDTNTSDIWGRGGLSNGHGGL